MHNLHLFWHIFRLCPLVSESLSLNVTKLDETEASYFPVNILYNSCLLLVDDKPELVILFSVNVLYSRNAAIQSSMFPFILQLSGFFKSR